jgi:DNA-binding Xre family transcriptional regulator/DNA replication protein DnaC
MARSRSLKLSPDGKLQVDRALTDKAWGNDELMEAAGVQIATVKKFRAGKAVDKKNFVKFCKKLELDWEQVADLGSLSAPNNGGAELVEQDRSTTAENLQQDSNEAQDVHAQGSGTTIVGQVVNAQKNSETQNSGKVENTHAGQNDEEKIRQHCREKILQNYSKVQLYNKSHQLNLATLYVSMYLQEQRSSYREASDVEMPLEKAMDVIDQHHHLFIEGGSGYGKSTLMSYLAMECCKKHWQPNLIPVLIELGRLEKSEEIDFNLNAKLQKTLEQGEATIDIFLQSGKFLLLLDGLDEVSTALRQKIISEVESCLANRILITCRSSIQDYRIPRQFKFFEVSKFNDRLQRQFIDNWFLAAEEVNSPLNKLIALQESCSAYDLWRRVYCDNRLRDLCTTPLLLSLICFIYSSKGSLPDTRSNIYERAIDVLLIQWDSQRVFKTRIESTVYQALDLNSKKYILTEIAYRMFLQESNFIQASKDQLLNWIVGVQKVQENESNIILDGIAADHGILIQSAIGQWKFLHLGFQEYFSSQWLLKNRDKSWDCLLRAANTSHLKEILQLAFESSPQKLQFLQQLQNAVDTFLSKDACLQELLQKIYLESEMIASQSANIQSSISLSLQIRIFYFAIATNDVENFFYGDITQAKNPCFNLNHLSHGQDFPEKCRVDYLSWELLYNAYFIGSDVPFNIHTYINAVKNFHDTYSSLINFSIPNDYKVELSTIRAILPNIPDLQGKDVLGWNAFIQWSTSKGESWAEQLRDIIIKHLDIRNRFKEELLILLHRYYEINKLLASFLEQCKSTDGTEKYECKCIEDNLLLPIAELKRRLPDQYGD